MKVNTVEQGEVEICNLPYIFYRYKYVRNGRYDEHLIGYGSTEETILENEAWAKEQSERNTGYLAITEQVGFTDPFDLIEYLMINRSIHEDEISLIEQMKQDMCEMEIHLLNRLIRRCSMLAVRGRC